MLIDVNPMHFLTYSHPQLYRPKVGWIVFCQRKRWLRPVWRGRECRGVWWIPASAPDRLTDLDLVPVSPAVLEAFSEVLSEDEAWSVLGKAHGH